MLGEGGEEAKEIRSAALGAVVKYRGEAEVEEAVEKALQLLKEKKHLVIAEIVLVHLLPSTREKQKHVQTIVGLFGGSADSEVSEAAERVLSRVGVGTAQEVFDELGKIEPTTRLQTLKDIVECQKQGDRAAGADDFTLFLGRAPDSMKGEVEDKTKVVEHILKDVREGKEVFASLFERASERDFAFARKVKVEHDTAEGDDALLVFITDCEADDIMFMAEMWRYMRKDKGKRCKPLVVFSANFEDMDGGEIFEKKVLLSALMLGPVDFRVLTPDPKDDTKPHPLKMKMAAQRESNLQAIVERIKEFSEKEVKFFICAPGHGHIDAIVKKLKKLRPLSDKQRKRGLGSVHLYSGAYNMKGENMSEGDRAALQDLVGEEGVLTDASAFLFFGAEDSHEVAQSFSTFALPSFSAKLNTTHPEIAAAWSLLATEFNMGLVKPNKLSETENLLLDGERSRLDAKYNEVRADTPMKLKDYASSAVEVLKSRRGVWDQVKRKKRSILPALARGSSDAPLCDQLIFLGEWAKDNQPKVPVAEGVAVEQWFKSEEGMWSFNKRTGYTSVGEAGPVKGTRAVMREPHDIEALYKMREALEKYTLGHLDDLEAMSEQEARGARWLFLE